MNLDGGGIDFCRMPFSVHFTSIFASSRGIRSKLSAYDIADQTWSCWMKQKTSNELLPASLETIKPTMPSPLLSLQRLWVYEFSKTLHETLKLTPRPRIARTITSTFGLFQVPATLNSDQMHNTKPKTVAKAIKSIESVFLLSARRRSLIVVINWADADANHKKVFWLENNLPKFHFFNEFFCFLSLLTIFTFLVSQQSSASRRCVH